MKIIKPGFEILTTLHPATILYLIEAAGRTRYKLESKITEESSKAFVANLLKRGHDSVLEHQSISVRVVCDRGVSHELVRHRIASFSQESARFCNYGKAEHITFIKPPWVSDDWIGEFTFGKTSDISDYQKTWNLGDHCWAVAMYDAEESYNMLLENGWQPQQARSVLPNSLKTEIVVTMNLREWRHFSNYVRWKKLGNLIPKCLKLQCRFLLNSRSWFLLFLTIWSPRNNT